MTENLDDKEDDECGPKQTEGVHKLTPETLEVCRRR